MKRFEKISPFIVMDILDRARRMEDVVHLEVGEPDLDASPGVIDAFQKAIRDGKYKYTSALGLMELREAIAGYYHSKYSLDISPERIAITPGTSGAFLVVYAMLLEAGQRIALSDPSYPCYRNFSYILNTEPVFIPVGKETEYCITPDLLDEYNDIVALQISSPSNPVGNVYSGDRLEALVEKARAKGVSFISDEIYHGLVYDDKERSALEFAADAIVINGFSKYFCMPGLRIGWMILPEKLMRMAEMAMQNVFIAANTPAQYAALAAFDETYLKSVRDTFRDRRDRLYTRLKQLFDIPQRPEGAFYIWVDVNKYGMSGMEFSERLLKEAKVAVTPGVDFGSNATDGFIRLAFTRPAEELDRGVDRIGEFLACLQK
ncbi:MAG: aminotransferase class I/II-fold pyridoxal phosphate-dependent enzyme [Nitrospirota bacterium]|nr:MAG: aminotransferase class I/II-fold pyridoxal phosphate-dependent enzyme [Nitrospirota bacterium]